MSVSFFSNRDAASASSGPVPAATPHVGASPATRAPHPVGPGNLPFGRAALALAEAILPGSATIPAADEVTVGIADETIGLFHPSLKKAWRIAQAALDTAAILQKGRPFHTLSADAQDALIRKWERDRAIRN